MTDRSFTGLSEVLFAVMFAWLLLNQLPSGMQLLGGAFIITGVALVRVDERGARSASTWNGTDQVFEPS